MEEFALQVFHVLRIAQESLEEFLAVSEVIRSEAPKFMLTGVVSGVAVHSPLSPMYFTSPSIRWILVRSTTEVNNLFASVLQIPRDTVRFRSMCCLRGNLPSNIRSLNLQAGQPGIYPLSGKSRP